MIAIRLTAVRSARPRLTTRARRILVEAARCCGWLSLGLALGAAADLAVRIAA